MPTADGESSRLREMAFDGITQDESAPDGIRPAKKTSNDNISIEAILREQRICPSTMDADNDQLAICP